MESETLAQQEKESVDSQELPDNGQLFIKTEVNEDATTEEEADYVPLPLEKEDIKKIGDEKGMVSLSLGGTKNIGNYENVKFQVGASMPCNPDNKEEKFDEVADFVRDKLSEVLEEVKEKHL